MGITFRFLSVAAKQQYRWHSRVSVFQAGLYCRSILDVFENYYEAKRQSPILGSEEFIERIRQRGAVDVRVDVGGT